MTFAYNPAGWLKLVSDTLDTGKIGYGDRFALETEDIVGGSGMYNKLITREYAPRPTFPDVAADPDVDPETLRAYIVYGAHIGLLEIVNHGARSVTRLRCRGWAKRRCTKLRRRRKWGWGATQMAADGSSCFTGWCRAVC